MEVRDSLEITLTGEYLNFLKCYFQAFSVILYQITKPQFVNNPENKLRNIVVDILNRLPHSELLRPFVHDLLKVAMNVLTVDNEENGLICIRIIFDLLRNFRPNLETEVQPFLEFVCKIYQNFRLTTSHFFDNDGAAVSGSSRASTFGPMGGDDSKLIDMSELGVRPAGYIGFGQLSPSTWSFKIVTEIPLVDMFLFQLYRKLVQTNIPQLLPFMVAAISVPGPEKVLPHLRIHFIELKGAQVKTVSFLTYLLKGFSGYIRPHEQSICNNIVNLLVTCPDSVSIRKKLLVALKHVLGTEFKQGLFPLIDTLSEERVLVGSGRACFETLRPLAYSLLAEIVHHVRGELSLSQDRILDAFVGKLSTFKRTIPQLMEDGDEVKARSILRSKLELPVQVSPSTHGTPPQVLGSASLSSLVPQPLKGMREDEVWLAFGVLKGGVHCLALFKEKNEEREMVLLFSQIFAIIEPRDLMDMFSLCMPELFECMISNSQLVNICSTLY